MNSNQDPKKPSGELHQNTQQPADQQAQKNQQQRQGGPTKPSSDQDRMGQDRNQPTDAQRDSQHDSQRTQESSSPKHRA